LLLEVDGAFTNLISHALFPVAAVDESQNLWSSVNKRSALADSASSLTNDTNPAHTTYYDAFFSGLQIAIGALSLSDKSSNQPLDLNQLIQFVSAVFKHLLLTEVNSICPEMVFTPPLPEASMTEGMGGWLGAAVLEVDGHQYLLRSQLKTGKSTPDTSNLFSEAITPMICLGHNVYFPGIRDYQVSASPVSVHLPLQRFLTKLFVYASYNGLNLHQAFLMLHVVQQSSSMAMGDVTQSNPLSSKFAISLADYPLRCLSFISQVKVGMWKRNGLATENIAYNYGRDIFSKVFRCIDIHALQIAMVLLGIINLDCHLFLL
jgi:hypothetical protein